LEGRYLILMERQYLIMELLDHLGGDVHVHDRPDRAV